MWKQSYLRLISEFAWFALPLQSVVDLNLVHKIVLWLRSRRRPTPEFLEAKKTILLQTTALQSDFNAIAITDPAGNILWANDSFTRITGYPLQAVLGKNMRILKSGRQDEAYYRRLWQTIMSGKSWTGEITNRRMDGSLYHEQQFIAPVQDERGKMTHFISVKMDITSRKQAEREVAHRNHELALLNKLYGDISSVLEPEAVLDTAARFFSDCLNIDTGLGFLYQADGNTLQLKASWGDIDLDHIPFHLPLDNYHFPKESIPSDIFLTRNWKASHESLERVLDPNMSRWKSHLCIPLLAQNDLLGFIEILHTEPDFFPPQEENFFKAIGGQVGVALKNAQLYQKEIAAHVNSQLLRRASIAFSTTLNIDTILETLLNYLHVLLDCDCAYTLLKDGDEDYIIANQRGGLENYPSLLLPLQMQPDLPPHVRKIRNLSEGLLISDVHSLLGLSACLPGSCLHSWLALPIAANEHKFGLMLAGKKEPYHFSHDQLNIAGALVGQAALAVQNGWLFEQVKSGRDRALLLSKRLVSAQETERRSLSHELHDETSQSLASLLVRLELLERAASDPVQVIEHAQRLEIVVNQLIDEMHRIEVRLRPASLDKVGLINSLHQYFEIFEEDYKIHVFFEAIGLEEGIPPEYEITIFRIVQESLTNVVRHAQATQVDILLTLMNEKLAVTIEDNGVGFDPVQIQGSRKLGLLGIRERAELLGGILLVESSPQVGTTIRVEIPCKRGEA